MSVKMLSSALLLVAVLCPVASTRGDGIPAAAMKQMTSLVGTWACETHADGQVVNSVLVARWSENNDAVVLDWRGKDVLTGKEGSSTGIIGWDGRKGVLFEAAVGSIGEIFTATHEIASDGWESPTKVTRLIDGKFVRETALRVFKWNSPNELSMVVKDRSQKGKDQPEYTAVFRRGG